jgi:hypothetical protein
MAHSFMLVNTAETCIPTFVFVHRLSAMAIVVTTDLFVNVYIVKERMGRGTEQDIQVCKFGLNAKLLG